MCVPVVQTKMTAWAVSGTGRDCVLFTVEDLEEIVDPNHLEHFVDKGGGFDELDGAADFCGGAQRVDKGADTGGVDKRDGLKVDDEKNVPAGERVVKGAFKLADRLAAKQLAF